MSCAGWGQRIERVDGIPEWVPCGTCGGTGGDPVEGWGFPAERVDWSEVVRATGGSRQ